MARRCRGALLRPPRPGGPAGAILAAGRSRPPWQPLANAPPTSLSDPSLQLLPPWTLALAGALRQRDRKHLRLSVPHDRELDGVAGLVLADRRRQFRLPRGLLAVQRTLRLP